MVDTGENFPYYEAVKIIFSKHASSEMKRRQIDENTVKSIFKTNPQRLAGVGETIILQGKYFEPAYQQEMLLRIIGKELEADFFVITVYRTSKIDKYWQEETES